MRLKTKYCLGKFRVECQGFEKVSRYHQSMCMDRIIDAVNALLEGTKESRLEVTFGQWTDAWGVITWDESYSIPLKDIQGRKLILKYLGDSSGGYFKSIVLLCDDSGAQLPHKKSEKKYSSSTYGS